MARPIKRGLDYFPLDVDIDQDDKFQLIEALHGITGFGTTIKLMMRIYKEGYYYSWTEMEQILFAKRVDVDINSVQNIVNDCIKYGVFDQSMFDQHQILTSRGIQMRYFEAVTRRKSVEAEESYLLVNAEIYPNVNRTIVNVNINPRSDVINEDIGTQSKGEERKGKEKKVEKGVGESEVFDFYISKDVKKHKEFTPVMKTRVRAVIKKHGIEKVMTVIDNYAKVYHGDEFFFNTKYDLVDVLRDKDIKQFSDEENPLYEFLKNKGMPKKPKNEVDWDNL